MLIDVVNKVLFLLVFLSILNILRNVFFLLRSIREKDRFILNKKELIILGISISYILLIIFDGIKL